MTLCVCVCVCVCVGHNGANCSTVRKLTPSFGMINPDCSFAITCVSIVSSSGSLWTIVHLYLHSFGIPPTIEKSKAI